jgi:hypothetical protein
MTAVLAMNSDYETVSASVSRNALLGDVPVALLRTIAEVLDIRCVLPRVSDLARPVVPHDALTLHISDWAGHSRTCGPRIGRSTQTTRNMRWSAIFAVCGSDPLTPRRMAWMR